MGFNIKNNYGPNIEVNEGGKVTLVQGKNGLWHSADAEEAEFEEVMDECANNEAEVNVLPQTPSADIVGTITPEEVKKYFRFPSPYMEQLIKDVVKEFYLGDAVNLALIEIVLYDHSQLQKRSNHTPFIKILKAWDALPKELDTKLAANCMSVKMGRLPSTLYKTWPESFRDDRQKCINIAKKLPNSMPYGR